MEKLLLICQSCGEAVGNIIKKKIIIDDYLIKEYNSEDDLIISSVIRCECGEYVIPTEENIIDYDEEI